MTFFEMNSKTQTFHFSELGSRPIAVLVCKISTGLLCMVFVFSPNKYQHIQVFMLSHLLTALYDSLEVSWCHILVRIK
jgi:hypothetical protein